MNKYINALSITLFTLALIFTGCKENNDPLADLRNYEPGNIYFTAELNSLHFQIETRPVSEVDSIFSELLGRHDIPVTAEGLADGTFTGESPYDAYDYKHVVELTINNSKIISVDYDEIHRSGKGKERDAGYNEEMGVTGMNPEQAYPHYERSLGETQNMMDIDAISGASYSLYRFRYAVMVALMKAKLKKDAELE
ncbi:hypothetical protein ACFLTH_07205 [Bacteroidota bacterium]